MAGRTTITWVLALAVLAPWATGSGPAQAGTAAPHAATAVSPAAPYDFNGDGRPELAVSVPGEDQRGRLYVVPGAPDGLGEPAFAPGITEPEDAVTEDEDFYFRWSVTSADFDRDGYADVAVAQPNHGPVKPDDPYGAVSIFYGSPDGLSADRVRVIHSTWAYQSFAESIVTADFNADGWPDLAVGAPQSDGTTGPSRPKSNKAARRATTVPPTSPARRVVPGPHASSAGLPTR